MGKADDLTRNSAPDLQILGDQITLQPRSYVEPQQQKEGKDEALMQNMARFRSEPLQFVYRTYSSAKNTKQKHCRAHYLRAGFFVKCPSMSPAKDGVHTIKSSEGPSSTPASPSK